MIVFDIFYKIKNCKAMWQILWKKKWKLLKICFYVLTVLNFIAVIEKTRKKIYIHSGMFGTVKKL